MKVYHSIEQIPAFKNAVITIGTFDGVHQGHCSIIRQLVATASTVQGESVLITFHPHPRQVVAGKALPLLNSIDEKMELLETEGVDNLVIIPFTAAFSQMDAHEYIEEFLIEKFHPHTIIIGYDHRFGKNRSGDFSLLEAYAAKGSFQLIEIPAHVIAENTVSSTQIRKALEEGNIEKANQLLGYRYCFEGIVVKGNQLGRKLGFPTANISLICQDKMVPGNGVYAVLVTNLKNPYQVYQGMMNIGIRPTIDGTQRVIEVNLFGFQDDIYGEQLHVEVCAYLRAEQKFAGLPALVEQLGKDKIHALAVLNP
ncbi:bifunctional riboflavin kinase/FAD synthetase [Gynurincola endophyticus]|uniref:bifunctional riboflavin kinase/FAD synthetase n=1 Tax=Gynurincola endophyticus TaxID=2479004 RepID=UPI000F8CBBAC|nr:bifunctional riboflavin kinase/FAD synthetase [Gynurincola endophyticus]